MTCESMLGHNDYFSTAIPNMSQASRSNIVQVRKKKSNGWTHCLRKKPEEVLDLVVNHRLTVAKECKEYNEELSEEKRKQMLEEHSKKMALLKKAQKERDKSHLHIITSSDELSQCIQRIDDENCSPVRKKTSMHYYENK